MLYRNVGLIFACSSALIYLVAPEDLIPDIFFWGLEFLDDVGFVAIGLCLIAPLARNLVMRWMNRG